MIGMLEILQKRVIFWYMFRQKKNIFLLHYLPLVCMQYFLFLYIYQVLKNNLLVLKKIRYILQNIRNDKQQINYNCIEIMDVTCQTYPKARTNTFCSSKCWTFIVIAAVALLQLFSLLAIFRHYVGR